MVFFSRKVHRKLGGNFTFLVLCDRDDLDNQIYRTYAGCGVVGEQEEVRAGSGRHLKRLLGEHKAYVFSLIQKFNQTSCPTSPTQSGTTSSSSWTRRTAPSYGRLALNQRNALPNALYIAFTGTPLMKEDEITRRVFGDYVSRYGFQRAVEDGATVPLYYDARGEKLGVATDDLNERIAEKLEEFETDDVDVEQRLERELKRDYHIITAPERLDAIARDFVAHYTTAWESGKAMFIAIDKVTAVRMHGLIEKHWHDHASTPSLFNDRIEMTQLDPCVSGSKAPVDRSACPIALVGPCADFLAQRVDVGYPPIQALLRQDAELHLGHVQPTAMFRRIHELQFVQQRARLGRREALVQRGTAMRVQVVHDQRNPPGCGEVVFHQASHPFGPRRSRVVGSHVGAAPIVERRVVHQQVPDPLRSYSAS